MGRKIKIGVLASSGGSALIDAYGIFNKIYPGEIELIVATDRKCGMEEYCKLNDIPHKRFEEKDRTMLSKRIADYFDDNGGVDVVVLFFLRIITEELFEKYITLNFHPSLLPDFPGMEPVKQALNANAARLGTTLHMVDEVLDGGDIVAQISSKLPAGVSVSEAESLSFCQKTYITLWFLMILKEKRISFKYNEQKGFIAELKDNTLVNEKNIQGLGADLEELYKKRILELGYGNFLELII